MVERYPHLVTFTRNSSSGDSYRDPATGQWVTPAGAAETVVLECRLKPFEMQGRRITDEDTEHPRPQFNIFCPMGADEIEIQQRIRVTDKITGDLLFEGQVKMKFRHLYHLKLWV